MTSAIEVSFRLCPSYPGPGGPTHRHQGHARGAIFSPSYGSALREYLSGKTFNASFANGTRVRSKFGADGSLATSAPSVNEAGKWRAEEGKLCDSLRKIGEFCSEARFDAGILYVRRMSGEIIRYETE